MIKTSLHKERLNKTGFCIVKDVFKEREIIAFQNCITQSINRIAQNLLIPFENSFPEESFNRRLELSAKKDPTYTNAIVTSLYADGHLSSPIDTIYTHNSFQRVIKKLILPLPNQNPTTRIRISLASHPDKNHPWHCDLVNPESKDCGSIKIACWIPLQSINKNNGSLEIINEKFNKPFVHQNKDGHFFIPEKTLSGLPTSIVECQAGDVVFIDRFTPHKSLPNLSPTVRWSILIWVKGFDEN